MEETNSITVTKNVSDIFEFMFKNIKGKTSKTKDKTCGLCEECIKINCGLCDICKHMKQFGGSGSSNNKVCKEKNCLLEVNSGEIKESGRSESIKPYYLQRNFSWGYNPMEYGDRVFYYQVTVNNVTYNVGDFVFCQGSSDVVPTIVRIEYMWANVGDSSIGFFHGSTYYRADETILGSTGNSQDIYLVDSCFDECPVTVFSCKANVILNDQNNVTSKYKRNNCLYLSKYYDSHSTSFTDLPNKKLILENIQFCESCTERTRKYLSMLPKALNMKVDEIDKTEYYNEVFYKEESVKLGSGIFIFPNKNITQFGNKLESTRAQLSSEPNDIISTYDESIYTEVHKFKTNSVEKTMEPLEIGLVKRIFKENELVKLDVYIMKRPENIEPTKRVKLDFSRVYLTNDERTVSITETAGLCNLLHTSKIPNHLTINKWASQSSNNFCYNKYYESSSKQITAIPSTIMSFIEKHNAETAQIQDIGNTFKPLKMMDVFSGCGGLSKGLESDLIKSCWAVETSTSAVESYMANFPNSQVFKMDCNEFLKNAINGESYHNNVPYPKKGEVDIICGGPPCQGWSGLNRFNNNAISKYRNSLITTFLSFCDHFRPKFVVFENIKNFSNVKKGVVLKLTLKCLLEMGYQCSVTVVDCGAYGVPQTRKRVIIIGAATGENLPKFPNPSHSFYFNIENKGNDSCLQSGSAPRRCITISDAMDDLPLKDLKSVSSTVKYRSRPKNDFQELMRGSNKLIRNHSCKPISPLSKSRVAHIPKNLIGADWRLLPNKVAIAENGKKLKKLKYTHVREDKSKGVCSCFLDLKCDPKYVQKNTIIPWGTVHTALRHSNWNGVYGRLSWNGTCSTLLCDPDPSKQSGRVIHPTEDRILTVREYARAQGFPDDFKFCGTVEEQYKQIGNSVPMPLARAIGREIEREYIQAKGQRSDL